jgi:predicted TIM-barrel fold metal-dependent hydrolase
MATPTLPAPDVAVRGRDGLAVIDTDTHCGYSPQLLDDYLPERWRTWLAQVGVRSVASSLQIPRQRAFAHRLDAVPPNGVPGSDPDFAREQLLDEYGISAAFLNLLNGGIGGHEPSELGIVMARGLNECMRDHWLANDPRWYGAITIPLERPDEAQKEIARCAEENVKWAQVMMSSRTDRPIGNPSYWPIFEAATHFDLPVAFHVGINRSSQLTACGFPNYYYEDHVGFAQQNFSLVPSLIFEGVFDRFPTLKIVLVELGWSWAAPFAWRLDASWRVLREEVAHLERKPSEYLREHFWFTSQPAEEPERPEWFDQVYEQFESLGFEDRLMFSSDYPHWDFDSPDEVLPPDMPRETKAKILAGNASKLYGIPISD